MIAASILTWMLLMLATSPERTNVGAVKSGAAERPRDEPPLEAPFRVGPPRATDFKTISEVVRGAETIRVIRMTTKPTETATTGSVTRSFRPRPVFEGVAPAGWGARWMDAVDSRVFTEDTGELRMPVQRQSWHLFEIQAQHGADRVRLMANFQFDTMTGTLNGERFGPFAFDSVETQLFGLLRDALPKDSALAKMSLAAPAEKLSSPPPQARSEKRSDGLPPYGEYVQVDELPEAIEKPAPSYPDNARKLGVDGTVLVQALVGKDGAIKDTRVVKSIPELDAAAVECIRHWRFKPAMAGGAPTAVWVAIPLKFTLR